MTTILVAKNNNLVVTDTCNYKPCSCFGQVAKDKQSCKTPCGMYNHPNSHILVATVGIFHLLTSHRTMQLYIQLHKILGNIF
jgi:hypothetical protein